MAEGVCLHYREKAQASCPMCVQEKYFKQWVETTPPLNLWNYPNRMTEKDTKPVLWDNFPQPFDAKKHLSANTKQYGGTHYQTKGIQPWDYIASNNMGFLEGCIIKYVSRYQDKGGIEDLKKAQHFLEKLIEVKSQ